MQRHVSIRIRLVIRFVWILGKVGIWIAETRINATAGTNRAWCAKKSVNPHDSDHNTEIPLDKNWTWSTTGYGLVSKSHDEIIELCGTAGLSAIEGAVTLFDGLGDSDLQAVGDKYRRAGIKIGVLGEICG